MGGARLNDDDLRRWVEQGIVTTAQRDAILRDLAERPTEERLTMTTVLYYAGGLLVLLAYSVFLAFQWEGLSESSRVAVSAGSALFFAIVSDVMLRVGRYQLPGELLQVVAVAVVPLLTFAVLDKIGVWPQELDHLASESEIERLRTEQTQARLVIAAVTALAGVLAFWRSRAPLALIAVLISLATFAVDLSILLSGERENEDLEATQFVVVAVMGAATFCAGLLFRQRTARNYSLWLYIAGIVGLAAGLGMLALASDSVGWAIVWMSASVGLVALSVALQERLLAVAGIAGVFAYLAKLVFDVFESAAAALSMAGLGVLLIAVAIAYQWLADRKALRGSV
jgi:hypothetical protein